MSGDLLSTPVAARVVPLATYWLPIPPTVNHYFVHRTARIKRGPKAGKVYMARMLSDDGQAFRAEVFRRSREGHRPAARLSGRLAVLVLIFPADRREQDLDNRMKPLLDALEEAGTFSDSDAQVDDLRAIRGPIQPGGGCAVVISRFDPIEVDAAMAAAGSRFYNPG